MSNIIRNELQDLSFKIDSAASDISFKLGQHHANIAAPIAESLTTVAMDIRAIAQRTVNGSEPEPATDWVADIGKPAYESIAEMVAALDCDYDRLEELREMRADWIAENPGNFIAANDTRNNWALAFPDEADELAELKEAAGECKDADEARERIEEDALSVEMRGDWYTYGTEPADAAEPVEFKILLATGGPAVQIRGELRNREPYRAWLEVQDWFKPWTQYIPADQDTLLKYCSVFYFQE